MYIIGIQRFGRFNTGTKSPTLELPTLKLPTLRLPTLQSATIEFPGYPYVENLTFAFRPFRSSIYQLNPNQNLIVNPVKIRFIRPLIHPTFPNFAKI
jgi:hypothetical protein